VSTSIVDVTTVLASLSVLGAAVGTGLWWLWRRAKDAAKTENRIARLEEALAAAAVQLEQVRAWLDPRGIGTAGVDVAQEHEEEPDTAPHTVP
jgi:hypothetical protein